MKYGEVFIISVPIGNLADITFRAIEKLEIVDCIFAEKPLVTKKLLDKYEIKTVLKKFNQHDNPEKLLRALENQQNIALVTDAGTPRISDPGDSAIKLFVKNNIKITPIPGVSAFLTALPLCDFPVNSFGFLGFFPHKKGRQKLWQNIQNSVNTICFYESVHRIIKLCEEGIEYIPNRKVMLARELTKIHEEYLRGDFKNILEVLKNNPDKLKGEFVVFISAN